MTKTAFITGATAGIGAAAAAAFVGAGWRVVATGRRVERLDALRARLGEAVHTLAFDVADEAAAGKAIAGLPEDWRDVDLLINNAGLALGTKPARSEERRRLADDDRDQRHRSGVADPPAAAGTDRAAWGDHQSVVGGGDLSV